MIVHVKIAGVKPLLQHRFSEEAELGTATRAVHQANQDPRAVAERSAYIADDGTYYMPSAAIYRALIEAGANHKLRGSRKSAKWVVPGAVVLVDDAITLLNGDGSTPIDHFEVDSRPVTIPATKGRIMRHRPRFEQWSLAFDMRINEKLLEPKFVHQLLSEAGDQLGIGDFRPQTRGPFGRFCITLWEERPTE